MSRPNPTVEIIIVLGTPVRRTNPSAGPPPKTITHRGVIEVINASNDAVLGYVSKDPLGAEDGALFIELDASNGLVVTFETDQTGSGTALNLAMEVRFYLFPTSSSSLHTHPLTFRTRARTSLSWVSFWVLATRIRSYPQDLLSRS